MCITKSQLINKPENLRRHIVILGAGASVAAFPNGDANGKILPTMDNFVESNQLPLDANFDELLFWLKPLVEAERLIL
ncbi:MAG: hypothetical protein AB1498_05040 [bacterium]